MSALSFINEFPILRHKLDLGEYHPDLAGNSVEVWLNLSDEFQEKWRAYNEGVKTAAKKGPKADLPDELKKNRVELFTELWNLDAVDVAGLFDKTEAAGLRAWMRRRSWEIIEEYASGRGESVGG